MRLERSPPSSCFFRLVEAESRWGGPFLCLDPTYPILFLPTVTVIYGPTHGAARPLCPVYILCLFSLLRGGRVVFH